MASYSGIGSMYFGDRCLTKLDVKVPKVSRRVCESMTFGQYSVWGYVIEMGWGCSQF